jgi:NhaP-type Na+/H+ or K+/H+ antiporter
VLDFLVILLRIFVMHGLSHTELGLPIAAAVLLGRFLSASSRSADR